MRSIALAVLVVASVGFVGERPADAAPCEHSTRVVRVSRRHHGRKHQPNQALPTPAPAPASTSSAGFEGYNNGGAAENQGSNTGWPRAATDPVQNEQRQIDQILASMMGEGAGGGHYEKMMNPKAKRVGIGLVEDSQGKLYLTNDFSE